MNSKERILTALAGGIPDRLPVVVHYVMPYFLEKYLNGTQQEEFFDLFGFDPIHWTFPHKFEQNKGEYFDPEQGKPGFLQSRRIFSNNWRITSEEIPHQVFKSVRYRIITPKGTLSAVLQSNAYNTWVSEPLIKEKKDIELIAQYMTTPRCDIEQVNEEAVQYGDRGLIRGLIPCFDIFGQPGCWQDACCLAGSASMIMATYDDPVWVHEFLKILQKRKLDYIQSLKGAKYDLLELGGGDASTTVISPKIFNEFVAPLFHMKATGNKEIYMLNLKNLMRRQG